MQKRERKWKSCLVLGVTLGTLGREGCVRTFDNNLEVLLQPQANLTLIDTSLLVKLFGPGVLTLSQYL